MQFTAAISIVVAFRNKEGLNLLSRQPLPRCTFHGAMATEPGLLALAPPHTSLMAAQPINVSSDFRACRIRGPFTCGTMHLQKQKLQRFCGNAMATLCFPPCFLAIRLLIIIHLRACEIGQLRTSVLVVSSLSQATSREPSEVEADNDLKLHRKHHAVATGSTRVLRMHAVTAKPQLCF
jgi:hypothetical protein